MSRAAPWVFALAVFVIHAISPMRVQSDSIWNVPVALSVLHHGDFTLDEYTDALAKTEHGVDHRERHAYNTFPVGASLVALPFLAIAELVPNQRWQSNVHAEGALQLGFFDTTEVLLGSMCVAVSVLFVLFAARARAVHRATPWLVAMVVAFASPAWSTASRSLWQHGPAMLFLAAAIWAWLAPPRKTGVLLGALLACAFVCRPTAAIPILAILLAVSLTDRRRLPFVTLGAVVIAAPWVWLNFSIWGEVLPPYYLPSRLEGGSFFEALAGNLVSAGRGLLIFCPLLLLVIKGARRDAFTAVALGVLVVHWVTISRFPHWWAGHSFGPRLFTELTPFWALLLAPWLDGLFVQHRWRSFGGVVTALLLSCTLLIHARGALSKRPWGWNTTPVNIDERPDRVWDFRDLQFLR